MQTAKFKNATKLKHRHLIAHKIHSITTSEYLRILVLRTVGNFLVLAAVFMIGKTFYQPVREEARYFIDTKLHKTYLVAQKKEQIKLPQNAEIPKGRLAKLLNVKPYEILVPEDPQFSIVIPKIGANARVISNVDVSDETVYLEALQRGVAQALGTGFPGEGGHIFLFAHSTDYIWNIGTYNAVFYLLYKLHQGDEVNLFYKGQRFIYRVTDYKIVSPSEVQYLTRKTDKEFLTLQTCWPPGTTLQRLLVFAERVAE